MKQKKRTDLCFVQSYLSKVTERPAREYFENCPLNILLQTLDLLSRITTESDHLGILIFTGMVVKY